MKENVLERNARMDTDRKIADFRVKQQMDYAFKRITTDRQRGCARNCAST